MRAAATLLTLSALISGPASAGGAQSPAPSLTIVQTSPAGKIELMLKNATGQTVKVWRDSNSWGAARWRVLRISQGQLHVFFENPDQAFTRNFPAYDELQPGKQTTKTLDLSKRGWLGGQDLRKGFARGDTIIVVYDVPASPEAWEQGVWHGVIADIAVVK